MAPEMAAAAFQLMRQVVRLRRRHRTHGAPGRKAQSVADAVAGGFGADGEQALDRRLGIVSLHVGRRAGAVGGTVGDDDGDDGEAGRDQIEQDIDLVFLQGQDRIEACQHIDHARQGGVEADQEGFDRHRRLGRDGAVDHVSEIDHARHLVRPGGIGHQIVPGGVVVDDLSPEMRPAGQRDLDEAVQRPFHHLARLPVGDIAAVAPQPGRLPDIPDQGVHGVGVEKTGQGAIQACDEGSDMAAQARRMPQPFEHGAR